MHDYKIIPKNNKQCLDDLLKGELEDIAYGERKTVTDVVKCALRSGPLSEIISSFPDPRKKVEVPLSFLLIPQILQRLNAENGYEMAPYLINDPELVSTLNYDIKVIEDGFNKKNKYDRETSFHGETLKHVLNHLKPESLISWNNNVVSNLCEKHAGKHAHNIFVIDGMNIPIPDHLKDKFPDIGVLKKQGEKPVYGYKVVWLMKLLDNKGIITKIAIDKINVHDITLGRKLLKDYPLTKGDKLIMDRGFLDDKFIKDLKENLKVDSFVPLKKKLILTEKLVANKCAIPDEHWEVNPFYKDQKVININKYDFELCGSKLYKSGVLVKIKRDNGDDEYIPFVTTDGRQTKLSVLRTYKLRSEIEEGHRQLKSNFDLSSIPSKKLTHIIFKIITSIIAYNIFIVYGNERGIFHTKKRSLKRYRRVKFFERDTDVIIRSSRSVGVFKASELLQVMLSIKDDKIITRLQKILNNIFTVPMMTA